MLKQKIKTMERKLNLVKDELPIMVLLKEEGKDYTLFQSNETYKTLEEFRKAHYLPENYNPVILEIIKNEKP